jgi:RimJ/RimL family protein N-acetyltransferase
MKSPLLIDLPMPIRTNRLLLRLPDVGDGQYISEAWEESLPELRRWLEWARASDRSALSCEETMRRFRVEALLRREIHLVIFERERLIGLCGLHNIAWGVPSATIGYWIRSSACHQGFATEAVAGLCRYAFSQLGMRRLAIQCDVDNAQSAAVAERLNFSLEVIARNLLGPRDGETDPRPGKVYVCFDASHLPDVNAHWNIP